MNTNKKILIADDDAAIQSLLKNMLTRLGYVVHSVYEGTDVMNMAIKEEPQLILLDMNMPGGAFGSTSE